MPDAGYFGLTYELLFEGDSAWTDITALVDSRTTKIDIAGCSEELKSVISKCTFEMRYNTNPSKTVHSELVGEILSAKQAGRTVRFRMGGIASFVGKVDLGSFSQRNGRIPGFLPVTVEDNSYLLDEVMASSFEYPATNDLDDEGYAVFDKANLAQSVVMLRLLDAGYTIDQIDTENSDSITEKVRRVVYDADDERTYREMLDTLLFEHCAVIYTTPEGKLSVRHLYRETPTSERNVDDFLVKDGIETGGGDYSYDGVKVVWSNLSRLDGAVVYNANITMKLDDEGNREGEEIQPQHYWPENGDIEETWQEFNATFLDREYQTKVSRLKNKDLSLISVKNAYYEVDKDAAILLANNPPEIEPTKARVLWWNSHSTDVKKLYGFTIVGDALFRSKLNDTTYPTDARKLDEPYETEFVYTSEAAAKLANHLHRFRKYGDLHHKWSEIGVATPLFQVVTVSAPDTLISSLGMVISQSISFPAPNKIKRSNSAIGITAFNSEPVKTRSIQLGGAPVNTGPAGSNGTRSVVQFILGTADGPYSDAGNVVGTDSAILGTDLALVGVDGAQWMYEAPTPDAGEIVWRREGYYTPPETWPKVWNITRMTGDTGAVGADGVAGSDGTSIIWKGEYASHPADPENGWAYRNTTDKKSYVYYDTWYQMTIDGSDGVDGDDGISIVWKGDSATAPLNPEVNWVYRDTDNGLVYIYNGAAWELMVQDGSDGNDGNDGASIEVRYSTDGVSWHDSYTLGDTYLSQRVGDGAWSSAIKFVGDSAYGITLHPSALTVPVSSRGVPYGGNITISAIFQNIPSTYEITWGIVGASFVDAGTNQAKVVEVDTITGESVIVTASVLFGGTTYNAPFVTLIKVYDGKPAPVYIGKSHSIPHDVGGEPIIAGDFFIVDEQFIDGATTYKVGEVWEYSGTAWVLSNSAMKAIDAMDDFVDIKLQDPSAIDEGIFCEVVAKKIMAQEAVITEIGTKEITLKTGGKIQSEIYDPGVAGFRFLADGTLDAIGASLVSGVFSGSIDSPPLTTTMEGELGNIITFNSFSHWKGQDLFNGLSSLDSNKWLALSGTYGSQSVTHLIKMPSDGSFQAYHNTGGYDSQSSVTFTYTIQHQGRYSFIVSRRRYYDHYNYYEEFDFYVNNIKNTSYSQGLDLQVGDVVRVYFHGAGWGSTPKYDSAEFTVLQNIPSGVRVENSSNVYHFPLNEYFSDRLKFPSLNIDTSTPTYNRYAKATAFLAGVSSYSINVFKTAQGTANIRGTDRNIIGVMRTTTGMTLFHSAGSEVLIPTISDPGTSGYYNISGFYQVQATVEGAATQNLNAKLSDTYSIGGVTRYLNIASKTMIAETFDNSSARDKKKDITPFLGSALDILKQVQVVSYRYKTETGEYLHTGFIADDTPDPLTGADHNSMSLGDNIGMLIKAVQELYQLILGGSNA